MWSVVVGAKGVKLGEENRLQRDVVVLSPCSLHLLRSQDLEVLADSSAGGSWVDNIIHEAALSSTLRYSNRETTEISKVSE